jgi:3-mercaptopyruvate sulfurtransferase SseA
MQSTGVTDAEGEEIFEWDIVEAMDHMGVEGDPARVWYDEQEAAWCAGRHWFLATFCNNYEVRIIGNRCEDPELINQQ